MRKPKIYIWTTNIFLEKPNLDLINRVKLLMEIPKQTFVRKHQSFIFPPLTHKVVQPESLKKIRNRKSKINDLNSFNINKNIGSQYLQYGTSYLNLRLERKSSCVTSGLKISPILDVTPCYALFIPLIKSKQK